MGKTLNSILIASTMTWGASSALADDNAEIIAELAQYELEEHYRATGNVVDKIKIGWIEHNAVLDEQTVVFYMKGGKAYLNRLDEKCTDLEPSDHGLIFSAKMGVGGYLRSSDTIKSSKTDVFNKQICDLGNFVEFQKPKYFDDDDKEKAAKKDALKRIKEHDALKKYEATGESLKRLNINRIDRTRILDDHTIVFYMRGKMAYVNYMEHRCPGLKSEDRFAYETFNGTLSNIDTISAIDSFGRRYAGCGLGDFIEFKKKPKDKS